jgi:Zn-dependent M32 family carboxypeptidase
MKGVAMQPGDEIESLISELEQIVNEGKTPFTGGNGKKIVDAQDIYEIIDEIRRVFPQEFADARRIVKEESERLERAEMQADAIISDARQQAYVIASDQEIVRLAQQEADQIRDQAQQYERDTRYNAEEYADTVLAHLEDNIKSLSNSVTRVRQTLSENSGARNSSNNVSW